MENTARSAGNSSAASMPVQPSLDGIASLAQPGTTPHSLGRSSNRVRTCSPAPFRSGPAPSVLLFSREHPASPPWPSVWASQILPRRPSRIQMQSGTLGTWARKNDTSCFSSPPYIRVWETQLGTALRRSKESRSRQTPRRHRYACFLRQRQCAVSVSVSEHGTSPGTTKLVLKPSPPYAAAWRLIRLIYAGREGIPRSSPMFLTTSAEIEAASSSSHAALESLSFRPTAALISSQPQHRQPPVNTA